MTILWSKLKKKKEPLAPKDSFALFIDSMFFYRDSVSRRESLVRPSYSRKV